MGVGGGVGGGRVGMRSSLCVGGGMYCSLAEPATCGGLGFCGCVYLDAASFCGAHSYTCTRAELPKTPKLMCILM